MRTQQHGYLDQVATSRTEVVVEPDRLTPEVLPMRAGKLAFGVGSRRHAAARLSGHHGDSGTHVLVFPRWPWVPTGHLRFRGLLGCAACVGADIGQRACIHGASRTPLQLGGGSAARFRDPSSPWRTVMRLTPYCAIGVGRTGARPIAQERSSAVLNRPGFRGGQLA